MMRGSVKPKYSSKNPIPETALTKFRLAVEQMARDEFGFDGSGSCPVEVHVRDRTRFDCSHFQDVPYVKDEMTQEETLRRVELLNGNLYMASNSLSTFLSLAVHRMNEKIKH